MTPASTIAYNELLKNNPTALKNAEAVLDPLSPFFMEEAYNYIAAAEWPDDIKGAGWKSFNPLHFVNPPIIDGFDGDIHTSQTNASFGAASCMKTLANPTTDVNLIPKSLCTRLMIHFIGDIHQPLHSSTLFSPEFPEGDMGGNLFEIDYTPRKSFKKLHTFWDATSHYYGEVKVPVTDKVFDKL